MSNFWNERYAIGEYVYGEAPNDFFAEQLQLMSPGKLLLPCEGEGRNGVFAASLGWEVHAFDSSSVGKEKALALAKRKGVEFQYEVMDAMDAEFEENSLDAVAFVYAHFPLSIRPVLHRRAVSWLKPGGRLILEAFNPLQLGNNSGGPKELPMLYTTALIQDDFHELETLINESKSIYLSEGKYHEGKADVVRYVGQKK
jgi:SAM-dependent methyltransferase